MKLYVGDKIALGNLIVASDPLKRLLGFMFKKHIGNDEGLFIPKCNCVHTLFMKTPIDIVYLDKNMKVYDVEHSVNPWRFCMPKFKAAHVLELAVGNAEQLCIKEGELLKCIN